MACASPAPSDFSELCGEHQAPLSVFCLDDLLPLCPQCADEDHSQHRVYLLSEAAADCKAELSTSLHKLKQKMTVIDKETQSYQQVPKHNQGVAELVEEQIKREFEQLHRMLQEEEADRLLLLKQDKDKKLHELEEQTKLMDELVVSLEERIRLTEAELDAGPVTLDARTAGQGLTVPFTLNTAHCSAEAQCVLDHPERFQPYSSVLAREGFSSGVHSWDIEVGECDNWTVGVASQSIQRRVPFEACPECGVWCISLRGGQYRALTTPAQTLPYNSSNPLKRIHVRLSFDSGILEFQNAELHTNIFIFNHNFTETVYPYFETTSHAGSLSIVPNEPSVSVSLEGDILEDFSTENHEIDSSKTDSKNLEKKKKTKKRIVKNGFIKTKPVIKQTPGKILFSDEYHVSLFRLQKKNIDTCNQIKHG